MRCIGGPDTPSEECNNLDDDCDGEIDEGNPGGSDQQCSTGLSGTCDVGTFQCVEGGMACEPLTLVGMNLESCNNVDDDCDGTIDEGVEGGPLERACYYGPQGTEGRGVCVAGVQECFSGSWAACNGMVTPSLEVCDTLDNDCDGQLDDVAAGNCLCSPPDTQDCYGGGPETITAMGAPRAPCTSGTQTCGDDGRWAACVGQTLPEPEECNAVDDDCDGTTDEDVPGVGAACAAGEGTCRREGTMACLGSILWCSASPGAPATETCNGLDDDCDGITDDVEAAGMDPGVGDVCSAGVGGCQRNGVWVCDLVEQALACNAQAGQPGVETCDGIDNDCDTLTDEGLGLGAVCTVGQGACQRQGAMVCGPGGAVQCSAVAGNATPETCDGVDNNCNGSIDEGFGLGNPCGQGACVGVLECNAQGEAVCSGAELAAAETTAAMTCADGIDNDCDGSQDAFDSGCM